MPRPMAYYNENDPFAAKWLRSLIAANQIALGEVDERSISDVLPKDLQGFTQCHFFAGIGVWSYALRNAEWADDSSVWTGSCPCQSFSQSGKRGGFGDPRHLWPSWFRLIRECRPNVVFGEQVASRDGLAWFDVVSSDLEDAGYTVGAADLCAAGFGAPHIRQRFYFVADTSESRRTGAREHNGGPPLLSSRPEQRFEADRLANADESGRQKRTWNSRNDGAAAKPAARQAAVESCTPGMDLPKHGLPSPTSGFWRDAEWLPCRDGKLRPVEPGSPPLVTGTPNRVGRLRGYGNSLCAPVAEGFIRAYMQGRS